MKEGATFSALSIVVLHKLSCSGVLKVSGFIPQCCFPLEINPSGYVNVNFFTDFGKVGGKGISLKAWLSILVMAETWTDSFFIYYSLDWAL